MAFYVSRYSSDYGSLFDSPNVYGGALPTSIETVKITPVLLAASGTSINRLISGGSFNTYATVPGSANALAFESPRYQLGSTSSNNAVSSPELIVASSALSTGSQSAWEVTDSGGTFTDITPTVSVEGLIVDHRALAMPWRSAARAAAVFSFGGTLRLMVKTDVGSASTTWTNQGTLTEDANMVTYRKGDANVQELYGTDGKVWYSPDHGATIYSKDYPGYAASAPALRIDVYG